MLKKDEGVILKSTRSGSSSKIVTFLGEKSGKIKLMAKGALRKESSFRGALEPGLIIEAVYYYKERRELFFLREVLVQSPAALDTSSLTVMVSVLAVLELLDQVCYPGHPDRRIVGLTRDFLGCLKARDSLFLFLAFQVKMLGLLGALPQFSLCSVCGAEVTEGFFDPQSGVSFCAREKTGSMEGLIELSGGILPLLEQFSENSFNDLAKIEVKEAIRKNLGLIMHSTYTYHVQGYRLPESFKLLKRD